MADVPEVLFVCVHNAGRSLMAAALLRHHAGERVVVRSAGSAPAEQVNPAVVAAMAELGIDLAEDRPTRLAHDHVRTADVVVTMGCGDACPVYPGVRYLDWARPDPAGKGVEEVRPIRDEIDRRVRRLSRSSSSPPDGEATAVGPRPRRPPPAGPGPGAGPDRPLRGGLGRGQPAGPRGRRAAVGRPGRLHRPGRGRQRVGPRVRRAAAGPAAGPGPRLAGAEPLPQRSPGGRRAPAPAGRGRTPPAAAGPGDGGGWRQRPPAPGPGPPAGRRPRPGGRPPARGGAGHPAPGGATGGGAGQRGHPPGRAGRRRGGGRRVVAHRPAVERPLRRRPLPPNDRGYRDWADAFAEALPWLADT